MQHLHHLIERNLAHPNYGRLLQHRDRNNPNILHYSVQLNDRDSLVLSGNCLETYLGVNPTTIDPATLEYFLDRSNN